MPASPQRYDLLAARLRAFTRTLPRLKAAEPRVTAYAWIAARRLREVLPILQLDGAIVEKLSPRLRKVTRKLGKAREGDQLLRLLDEVEKVERRGRQATARVRDDLQRLADRARADLFRRKVGNDVRRVADKLATTLLTLRDHGDTQTQTRAMQWAMKARVARRASDLRTAINAAGSVYLAGRLENVRVTFKKVRFAAELAADLSDYVASVEVRKLTRVQLILEELADLQTLVDRIRHVQGSLATPDLKAWKDLDRLVVVVENRCRTLHARYVRERESLTALCDRLAAHAPVDGSAKRKAS